MSGRRQIHEYPEAIRKQIELQIGDDARKKSPVPQFDVEHDPLEPSPPAPKHTGRYVVRLVSYRRRLLDKVNLYGGSKFFEDGLRYAGLIPDDREAVCDFEASQVQVKLKADERTEITVSSPGFQLPSTPDRTEEGK